MCGRAGTLAVPDPEVNQEVWQSRICCGVVNRGLALYKDMVIAPVVDGRMRALDEEKTGPKDLGDARYVRQQAAHLHHGAARHPRRQGHYRGFRRRVRA